MSTKTATRAFEPTALAAIVATAAVAWLGVLLWVDGAHGFALYLSAWTVMMVAMMLPSAAPLLLLYRTGSSGAATARLATGYLGTWATTGVIVWALRGITMQMPAWIVLAAAGIYQLTPAKQACLRRCRSPADFLVQHWHPSALRIGAQHGWYCLGCCWALMAVLVVAGMMSIGWVIAITGVVAAEKLLPRGEWIARLTGVAFLLFSFLEVLRWM